MANPIRFRPLDGIPDADQRGAGTFEFDDGTSMVAEDPELASLVKSYQADIPELQNLQAGLDAVPDMRLAANDATDDPIGSVFGADPFGDNPVDPASLDTNPAFNPAAPIAPAAPVPEQRGVPKSVADFSQPSAPVEAPAARGYIPPGPASSASYSAPMATPPDMTDAGKAAELHRLAGEQALRGTYTPGRAAGYTPAQRTGRLDPEVATAQGEARAASNEELANTTTQARQSQADLLRQSALQEAMRLTVQREDQQRMQREAEQKRQRLLDERRAVNNAEIDTTFAQGDSFRQVMAVMGAALLGAVGSDAGLRMIESNIDRHVRKEMQVRGSKLQALAEEIGSEEQVVSAAKARIYELMEKQAGVTQKTLQAAEIENQTPAVLAELKRRALDNDQQFERESLGKVTEVYQQAQRGGFSGPNLDKAASHYDAAVKSGQGAKPDKATVDAQKGLAELKRLRDNLKRGQQSGALKSVVGWQDKLGANSVQDFFGGLPPEQKEQATTLEELQVGNLMRLVREPNNMRTQNMVQQIGTPKNDRDIDGAIRRLDQLIAIEESGYKNGPQPVEIR
jgi:hypothetical protein